MPTGCSARQNTTTMTHDVDAVWMGKMQFNALVGGHTVTMDAPERAGGEDQGPIPKPFMLTALAGCTGMDVVALLRKADKPLDRFEVRVSGEISKTQPIQYTSVHLTYEMHGDAAHEEEALRVVGCSQNELCGVSAMIKRALPVTWEVTYNGVERFNNKAAVAVGA
jgi:putative redox protein